MLREHAPCQKTTSSAPDFGSCLKTIVTGFPMPLMAFNLVSAAPSIITTSRNLAKHPALRDKAS
jgi:hypothetical protein